MERQLSCEFTTSFIRDLGLISGLIACLEGCPSQKILLSTHKKLTTPEIGSHNLHKLSCTPLQTPFDDKVSPMRHSIFGTTSKSQFHRRE